MKSWHIPGAVYQVLTSKDLAPAVNEPTILQRAAHAGLRIVRPTLADAKDMLQFELTNRAYFEQWINPRAAGYYCLAGVSAAIEAAAFDAERDSAYQYLVKVEHLIVGRVNLNHVLRPYFNKAELGYRIGEQHAGKGIATQAAGLLLAEAFETLGFKRIEATVRELNVASVGVLKNNGFNSYGKSLRSVQHDGGWFDLIHMSTHRRGRSPPST